jgi:hypothetical protein
LPGLPFRQAQNRPRVGFRVALIGVIALLRGQFDLAIDNPMRHPPAKQRNIPACVAKQLNRVCGTQRFSS